MFLTLRGASLECVNYKRSDIWCQTVSKMRLKYYPLRPTRMDEAKKRDWYHGWNKCLKNRIGDDVAGLKKS